MKEFCEKIAEILDVPALTESSIFADFPEWDSLSILSAIAMIDADYGVNLRAADIAKAGTPKEIWTLVESRQGTKP